MASGLPDYYSRSYVNIDQQNISEVAIDIAKQSLANLDININKQTVTELAIDIAKQSIATLGIDIKSQSIGNLAMDIAQQSLGNLGVDIGSQSIGNLDINIKNQEISQLSIDIAKQTIGQILQRPIYGTGQQIYAQNNYVDEVGANQVNISGQGKIYGGFVHINGALTLSDYRILLVTDATTVFRPYLSELEDWGIFQSPYIPFSRLLWDKVNNKYTLQIMGDITFESGFYIKLEKDNWDDITITTQVTYALI